MFERSYLLSLGLCGFFTFGFVASLYIWGESRDRRNRDRPSVIKKRFISVFFTCLLSYLLARIFFGVSLEEIGIPLDIVATLKASTIGLGLTVVLFLGPLVELYFRWDSDNIPDFSDIITIRNLIVGPLTEEIVFRALMIPVLLKGGFRKEEAIVICMLFFGLAHTHHFGRLQKILFMMFYTTVFGGLSSFLFLRTGHILAPILSHIFCNYMGFPHVDRNHKQRKVIAVSFVLGLMGFIMLAKPCTDPMWHQSIYYLQTFHD